MQGNIRSRLQAPLQTPQPKSDFGGVNLSPPKLIPLATHFIGVYPLREIHL